MENKMIYFDHLATTPVKPEVVEEMMPYYTNKFGNASSIYSIGRESKKAIEEAREKLPKALGAMTRKYFYRFRF